MTDRDYTDRYKKIADQYENNQSSMGDYLEAMRKLKEKFLKEQPGAPLPAIQV